jgi:hypothetical protein
MPGTNAKLPQVPDMLIDMIGSHFLETARYLREIQDQAPENFAYVVEQLKLGKRKAYALAKIDRSFHDRGVDRERLRAIGWTKLWLLSPFVGDANVEAMLQLAEATTANELKLILQGQEVDPEGKVIVLYLRRDDLAIFDKVMAAYGAIKHPRGWLDKEEAIMRAMRDLPVIAE